MTHISRRAFTVSVLGAAVAASRTVVATQQQAGGATAAPAMSRTEADALAGLTLAEASARIKAGTITSTALVNACLARIDIYNPKSTRSSPSRASGRSRKRRRSTPSSTPDGCATAARHLIALKDNIDTAGVRTTAASAVFDDRVPAEDAEVARRLAAAGAVVIGKANLHEFAFGGTSATSYYGPVRNPWALERNPGGSSGGSAAAVATDLCYGALGTDTGGSIRTPASYCSVVGLKPTYGLVSIRGIIPLTLSLGSPRMITR
jgi:aspartyl-tRNA(Asn)/glutamyl-tRNA(Gln) amidotransferase subunit A